MARGESYKVHSRDAVDVDEEVYEEELEEDDYEEGDPEDEFLPKWLRYARVRPKRFWTRPFLGGDETPKGMLSFVLDTCYIKGTVFRRCILPSVASVVVTLLVIAGQEGGKRLNFPTHFFLPFFLVTLFVTGFRLYGAWHSYRRGHEMVLQMGSSAVDALLTATTCVHVRSSGMDLLELVRRLNVLVGFIRQDLRESRHHIIDNATFKAGWPKGMLATEWFESHQMKFTVDPYGSPPLRLLLTDAEKEVYKKCDPQDRVIVCTIALRTLFAKYINYGAQKMSTPDSKIFQNNIEKIIHSWTKCREIIKTPPPFVLHHFGLVLTAMLCFLFAPLYFVAGTSGWFPVLPSFAITFAMYGLEEAACEMEVPFGWRATDCNLSKMCRTTLKRSLTFCKICKVAYPNKPKGASPVNSPKS